MDDILNKIESQRLKDRAEKIKKYCSRDLEFINTQGLFRFYNRHGPSHSQKVWENIKKLLESWNSALSEYELFLEEASAWCHDLGMFKREGDDFEDSKVCEKVRKTHHERISEYLSEYWKEMGLSSEPEAVLLKNICWAHSSKADLSELKEKEPILVGEKVEEVRTRFLGALLRLADALDAGKDRLPPKGYRDNPKIPKSQHEEYWKHEIVDSVEITNSSIIISMSVEDEYSVNVVEKVKKKLNDELDSVKGVFSERDLDLKLDFLVTKSVVKSEKIREWEKKKPSIPHPKPVFDVRNEGDLSEMLEKYPLKFMENRLIGKIDVIGADKPKIELNWGEFKDKLMYKNKEWENKFEKFAPQTINFIHGKYGVGKSIYLLNYVEHCVKESYYKNVVFINNSSIHEFIDGLGYLDPDDPDYAPAQTLIVVDALCRGESDNEYRKKCVKLFNTVKDKGYSAIVTLRDDDYNTLKKVLKDKWNDLKRYRTEKFIYQNYKSIRHILATNLSYYEIPFENLLSPSEILCYVQNNEIVYSNKEVYKKFDKCAELLFEKSKIKDTGLPTYVILLVRRIKYDEKLPKEFSEKVLEEFPSGFENLVWDTIEKNHEMGDRVIPIFILILKNHDFVFTKQFRDFLLKWSLKEEKEEEKESKIREKLLNLEIYLEKSPISDDVYVCQLSTQWKNALDVVLKDRSKEDDLIKIFRELNRPRDFSHLIDQIKQALKDELEKSISSNKWIPTDELCLVSDIANLSELKFAKEVYLGLEETDKISHEGKLIQSTLIELIKKSYVGAKNEKRYDEAKENVKEMLKIYPDNPSTWFSLALISSDGKEKVNAFKEAIRLGDKTKYPYFNTQRVRHAYIAFLIKQLDTCYKEEKEEIKEEIEEQFEILLKNPDALTLQGCAIYNKKIGKHDLAMAFYKMALEKYPDFEEYPELVTGKWISVIQSYAIFCKERGYFYRKGQPEEAEKYYNMAKDLFEKGKKIILKAYEKRAKKLFREEEKFALARKLSIPHLLNAYAIFENEQAIRFRLDENKKEEVRDRIKHADKLLRDVIQKYDPYHVPSLTKHGEFLPKWMEGNLLERLGDNKIAYMREAEGHLRNALKIESPEDPLHSYRIKNILGILLFKYHCEPDYPNYDIAEKLLKESVQSDNILHNAMTFHELAVLYVCQDKINEAEEAFRKSIDIKGTGRKIFIHLAIAHTDFSRFLYILGKEEGLFHKDKAKEYTSKIVVRIKENNEFRYFAIREAKRKEYAEKDREERCNDKAVELESLLDKDQPLNAYYEFAKQMWDLVCYKVCIDACERWIGKLKEIIEQKANLKENPLEQLSEILYLEGLSYRKLEKFDNWVESASEYLEFAKLLPGSVKNSRQLGEVNMKLGMFENTINYYKKILEERNELKYEEFKIKELLVDCESALNIKDKISEGLRLLVKVAETVEEGTKKEDLAKLLCETGNKLTGLKDKLDLRPLADALLFKNLSDNDLNEIKKFLIPDNIIKSCFHQARLLNPSLSVELSQHLEGFKPQPTKKYWYIARGLHGKAEKDKRFIGSARYTEAAFHYIYFLVVKSLEIREDKEKLSDQWGVIGFFLNEINKVSLIKISFEVLIECFQHSVNLNDKNDRSWSNLGWQFYYKRELDKAEYAFKNSLALNKNNSYSLTGLGKIAEQRGERNLAKTYYEQASELIKQSELNSKDKAKGLMNIANNLIGLGFIGDTFEMYETIKQSLTERQKILMGAKKRFIGEILSTIPYLPPS
jgi:Tfp pilus assembly protein PilF